MNTRTATGWKIVPVEPTEAMIEAHFAAHARAETVFASVPDVWRAMLAASPTPPDSPPSIDVVVRALRANHELLHALWQRIPNDLAGKSCINERLKLNRDVFSAFEQGKPAPASTDTALMKAAQHVVDEFAASENGVSHQAVRLLDVAIKLARGERKP